MLNQKISNSKSIVSNNVCIAYNLGCSDISPWKYQFSYNHWSQATLSSVST